MKALILALLLTLSVMPVQADDMKCLIDSATQSLKNDDAKVYCVTWRDGNKVIVSGVNATSLEQVMLTMRTTKGVKEKDILSIKVKK